MDIRQYYPAAIVERICDLPPKDRASPRELRIINILHDEDVAKKAQHVLKTICRNRTEEECTEAVSEFWYFIESAAELPDIPPRGAVCHSSSKADFFTPGDVRVELKRLRDDGRRFAKRLAQRSDLILFDRLDELVELINAFVTSPQIKNAGDRALPNHGKAAGKMSFRNHLLRQLSVVAQVRLGDRFLAFITEVLRVLTGATDPLDLSTAKSILGQPTDLVDSV